MAHCLLLQLPLLLEHLQPALLLLVSSAGVLALLQESGEAPAVVAAGEQWLALHRQDPGTRDVALATALAHRAVAAAHLERKGDVMSGEHGRWRAGAGGSWQGPRRL